MKISNNRRPGDVVKQLDTIAGQMKKTERSQQSKRCIGRRKVVAYETCDFYWWYLSEDGCSFTEDTEITVSSSDYSYDL